ncbi:diacylglycerol kinase family lipid kinase [Candidatus Woesearchaeota archaeon]|nr:diacylglycerol kinase family lipid kinase [Candidatus Woesearchaeota archaeon]
MKAILIINPKSGETKKKMPPILKWTFKRIKNRVKLIHNSKITPEEIVEEVSKKCKKEKIKLTIEFTKYPKHAMELAKDAKDKYDLIIVAGGDGTINEVINGMIDSKATLVVIPFGSTNVLALELGIPFDVKKSSELITQGKKIEIDLGYAKTKQEGRYFSMMLGVGFVPSLIKKIKPKFKKKWGRWAYPFASIHQIFKYEWYNIHVKHKIHSIGYFIVVSNSKCYGGEYQITDEASPTDGFLDLVVINRKNWWEITKIIFSISTGKTNNFFKGEYFKIKEAHIYSRRKLLVQVDGELIGQVPVNVTIVPKALNIMVKK